MWRRPSEQVSFDGWRYFPRLYPDTMEPNPFPENILIKKGEYRDVNQAREDINCDIVYSMGITGKGVGVAVLDTGVYLHEDFKDRVTAFADYVNHRPQPMTTTGMGPIYQPL